MKAQQTELTLKTSTSSKTSSSVCKSSLGRTMTFWTVPRSVQHQRRSEVIASHADALNYGPLPLAVV